MSVTALSRVDLETAAKRVQLLPRVLLYVISKPSGANERHPRWIFDIHFLPKSIGVRKQTSDTFLSGLCDQVPDLIIGSLANARRNLTKSRISPPDFIDIFNNQKLIQLAKQAQVLPPSLEYDCSK